MSNLVTFLEHTEEYRRDLRRVEYGDERDPSMRKFMENTAPLNNTTKMTKPLFVVAGKNDPRVSYTEAEQLIAKVRAGGGDVRYMLPKTRATASAKSRTATRSAPPRPSGFERACHSAPFGHQSRRLPGHFPVTLARPQRAGVGWAHGMSLLFVDFLQALAAGVEIEHGARWTRAEYEALLRQDFTTIAARCFHELNPQAELAMNWHIGGYCQDKGMI
jgi:hypothetical protein